MILKNSGFKIKPVTKSENPRGVARLFSYCLIVLGSIVIFTAPFWHIEFPKQTEHITNLKKELKGSEEVLISMMEDLWTSCENGNITAENYIIQNKELEKKLERLRASNAKRLRLEISENKIFNWNTPRIFLIGFGVRLPYVIFSLIISLLIAQRQNDPKKLRMAFMFLQICCWSISIYLMIWVFWYSYDYPFNTYRYAIIATSMLMGVACTYYISNYTTTVSRLKSKIGYIMNLMVKQSVDQGHIKDEQRYDDEIVYPALRKLDEQ